MATQALARWRWFVSFEQHIAPPEDSRQTPSSSLAPVKLRPVSSSAGHGSDETVEFVFGPKGEATYPLLSPMANLVLPLLRIPEVVNFDVRIVAPAGKAVMTKAVVDVRVADTGLEEGHKATLQKLYHAATREKIPHWKLPFSIETDVEVVQPGASYSLNYIAGWLCASSASPSYDGYMDGGATTIDIISVDGAASGGGGGGGAAAAMGVVRHRLLPEPFPMFTELMLRLLEIPEEVDLKVRTYVPDGRAITRARIDVELKRRDNPSCASTLRKLFSGMSSARFKRRRQEKMRAPVTPVELLPEIVRLVISKLPWKETFGAARRVNKSWRDAADAVSPPSSFRREVHERVLKGSFGSTTEPSARGTTSVSAPAPAQAQAPPRPAPSSDRAPGSGGGRTASAGGGGEASLDRRLVPSVSWLKLNGFVECSGGQVMDWFQAAVDWLEQEAVKHEECTLFVAMTNDDSGEAEGGEGEGEDGEARLQWRRLKSFLDGVRALCENRGISCDASVENRARGTETLEAARAAASSSVPFGLRVGVEAIAAVAQAAAAAAAAAVAAAAATVPQTVAGGGNGGVPSPTSFGEVNRRWDGWLVLSTAIALAVSEDRSFLCRCVLESPWGTAGLPRTQVIELLCKMHLALRPPPVATTAQLGPVGFQAAASIPTVATWDATGSYRLRNDLLQCIYALEGYFVRFPQAQPSADEDDDSTDVVELSQMSNLSSQTADLEAYEPVRVDKSKLTDEQREVVHCNLAVGDMLRVVAYAGTGKTSTLRVFAQEHPDWRILYVVFNKSVQLSANETFPNNTTCRTMSSLAMTGRSNGGDLSESKFKDALHKFVCTLDGNETPRPHTQLVFKAIMRFCQSKDSELDLSHVRIPRDPPQASSSSSQRSSRRHKRQKPPEREWIFERARGAWTRMCATRGDMLPKFFTSIVKEFQLSSPDLSGEYDVIMLDEAQDIDPCQADIVDMQTKCRVVIVGDPHQAIYGWRGARDYLEQARCSKTLRLTQCFRFGHSIASVANMVLLELKNERQPLLPSSAFSKGGMTAKVLLKEERADWLRLDDESKGCYTIIARTNGALIKEAMASIGTGGKFKMQGGPWKIIHRVKVMQQVCHLMMGNKREVKDTTLKEFESISSLRMEIQAAEQEEFADDPELQDLAAELELVDSFVESGKTPEELIEDLENLVARLRPRKFCCNDGNPVKILSTVHAAKGLEYDTVVMADDFSFGRLDGGWRERKHWDQTANLLYVAITRARRRLFLHPKLVSQLQALHMWDSLALWGTTSDSTASDATPLSCHGRGCTNADAHGPPPAAGNPSAGATATATAGAGARAGAGVGANRSAGEEAGERSPGSSGLLFAGSGSVGALCRTCVEGGGADGQGSPGLFPYAAEFFTPSR